MIRQVDCAEYRARRKQQARKLSEKSQPRERKRRREETSDCVDEEKEEEEAERDESSPDYRKCKETAKKRRKQPTVRSKPVPSIEMFLRLIQPSIEEREQFFNPRHVDCLLDLKAPLDFAKLRETAGALSSSLNVPSSHRRVPKGRKKVGAGQAAERSREEKDHNADEESAVEEEADGKTSGGGTTQDKKPDGESERVEAARSGRVRKKGQLKRNGQRKRIQRSDVEETGRPRIVSPSDSDVCLADVMLTSDDKKKIGGYQRETQPSVDN